MERNRRRRNIKRKKTSVWKRCLAAAVAAVTVLSGMNYDGLANVFAKETSGYQIDVSYSSDKTSAVLKGNAGNVPTGTTVTGLTGSDGTEYDPNNFEMSVTKNGTYKYTLEYSVTLGDSGETAEREEELSVTVDRIAAKQTASKTAQSTEAAASGAQSSSQASSSTAQQAVTADSTEAPETVPLAELKAELATLADDTGSGDDQLEEAQYNVYQYAYEEKGLSLANNKPVPYTGGSFAENAPEYTESGITRKYVEAALVIVQEGIDEDVGIPITGLYPYSLQGGTADMEWYYTTASNTQGSDDGYGTIQVGYRLPDNAQVRLYYQVPDNPLHKVVFQTNNLTSITPSEYQLQVILRHWVCPEPMLWKLTAVR